MNENNFQKFVLLGAAVAIVIISGVIHPSFFVSGSATTADAGGAGGASGTANSVPILVLPSLSADIAAQAPITSSGSSVGSNAKAGAGSAGGPASNSGANSNSNANGIAATSSVGSFVHVATTPVPDVGVSAALISDLQTGAPFLDMNAGERWPMASVSKLMTAVVATDLLAPKDRITITAQMTAADPTENILHAGDTYSVSDLLRVMLLPSNNVAAESLAQFYGRTAFLAAMNAKAQAWGMTNTYYDDPSGLSAANESTANDLLKLAQNIYASYPSVLAITRMPSVTVFNVATSQPVTVKSINYFAGDADFIGGKTGYTDQADGNLLSIFDYENQPVFIVILGINDGVRFDATQELYAWLKTDFK